MVCLWFVMVCLWFSLGFSSLWARNLEKHKESYHFGSNMKELLRKTLKSWLAGLLRLETSSPGSPESTPRRLRQASQLDSERYQMIWIIEDYRACGYESCPKYLSESSLSVKSQALSQLNVGSISNTMFCKTKERLDWQWSRRLANCFKLLLASNVCEQGSDVLKLHHTLADQQHVALVAIVISRDLFNKRNVFTMWCYASHFAPLTHPDPRRALLPPSLLIFTRPRRK